MTSEETVVAVPGWEPWRRSGEGGECEFKFVWGRQGELLKKRLAILVSQKRALGLRYKSGNCWHSPSFIHTFIHPADIDRVLSLRGTIPGGALGEFPSLGSENSQW